MSIQLYDFEDGLGFVPAHQHKNPDGSVGGWVAETAWVDSTAYVGENTKVYGHAQVFGKALIYGNAKVYGKALICGNAQIYSQVQVYGQAQVFGQARVYDYAYIHDQVQISNNVHINKKMRLNHITKIESHNDIIYGEMKFNDNLYPYTIYQDVENVIWIWFIGPCQTLEEWKSYKSVFPIYQQFVKFLNSVN